jgi:phosphoribosylglycinamide formyltransferase-1
MNPTLRIGALISGGGTNLQAIIDACEIGRISGKIVFVGSDNPDAFGLGRAQKHGIPTFVVPYREIIRESREQRQEWPADFDLEDCLKKQHVLPKDTSPHRIVQFVVSRVIAEARLLGEMAKYPFDLLVLAGFMRNITPYFLDRVNTDPQRPRIMNIHPALLPAFPGTDGYGDTFRHGCRVGGCTVHFVDYGEDSGPIIGQRCFPIQSSDTLEMVKKNGLEQEWILYPECIQAYAEGRLRLERRAHSLDNGRIVERTVVVWSSSKEGES